MSEISLIDGRFEIGSEIASGGFGTVYHGRQVDLDRPVAIKILHAHLCKDQSFLERFLREARAAAKVAHPNLVQVIQTGTSPRGPYIVYEFVPGQSLRDILKQNGGLPWQDAVRITSAVADSLAALHTAGIVHRDLKPDNIRITPEGRVVLLDLGIAKNVGDSQLTQTGTFMGTPEYMSPELLMTGEMDHRGDIYALGIVLWETIVGVTPFKGNTPLATANMHISGQIDSAIGLPQTVPATLREIIAKMSAREPNSRFENCREVATALRAMSGETQGAITTLSAAILISSQNVSSSQTSPADGVTILLTTPVNTHAQADSPKASAYTAPPQISEAPAKTKSGMFLGIAVAAVVGLVSISPHNPSNLQGRIKPRRIILDRAPSLLVESRGKHGKYSTGMNSREVFHPVLLTSTFKYV